MRRIDELESLVKQQQREAAPAAPGPVADTTPQAPQIPAYPMYHDGLSDVPELPADLSYLFSPSNLELFPPMPNLSTTSPSAVDQTNVDEEPLTIPIGHLTATGTLFSLEPVLKLIGEYPENYFYQIESSRTFDPHLFDGLPANLDPAHIDALLAAFFSEIHPHFPILDPVLFSASFHGFLNKGIADDPNRALCLVILALGQLACKKHPPLSPQSTNKDTPGVEYFCMAHKIATTRWVMSFNFSVPLCSALIYCAIFLCYLQYPLQAWRLIHMASTKLQMMLPQ